MYYMWINSSELMLWVFFNLWGEGCVCFFFFVVNCKETYAGFYATSIIIKGKQKIYLWVSLRFFYFFSPIKLF